MNGPQLKYPKYIMSNSFSPTPVDSVKSSIFKMIEQKQYQDSYMTRLREANQNIPTVVSDPLINLRVRQYYREKYERTVASELAGRTAGAAEGAAIGAGTTAGIGGIMVGLGWVIRGVGHLASYLIPGDMHTIALASDAIGGTLSKVGKTIAAQSAKAAMVGSVAGSLVSDYSTYYATRDLFENTFIKSFKNKNVLQGGLNTLATVGKSMDILEGGEAIRSIIYSVINGENVLTNLKRAYGLDEEYGRKEFNFSDIRESMGINLGGAGNIIFDMTGEVITDPGAYSSIFGKGINDIDFQKVSQRLKSLKEVDEVIDDTGKAIKVTKNAAGEFIDSSGKVIKASSIVKSKTHWYTKITGLDGTTVKKSISDIENTIKDSVHLINKQETAKELSDIVSDGNNSITKQLAKIIRDGDDAEAKVFLAKTLGMPKDSEDIFSAFLNNIRTESAKSTAVKFFRACDTVDHVDDTLTGILFKATNGPVACMSMINKLPTFLNSLSTKLKFADNINKYLFGNQAPDTIIQGAINKTIEKVQLSKGSKKYYGNLALDPDYKLEFVDKLKKNSVYGYKDLTEKIIADPNNTELFEIRDGYIDIFRTKSDNLDIEIEAKIKELNGAKTIDERKQLVNETKELISDKISYETQIKYLSSTVEDYKLHSIMGKLYIINAIRKKSNKLDSRQAGTATETIKELNDLIKNSADKQRLYDTMNDFNYGKLYDEINTTWNDEIDNTVNFFCDLDKKTYDLESKKTSLVNEGLKTNEDYQKEIKELKNIRRRIEELDDEIELLELRRKEEIINSYTAKNKSPYDIDNEKFKEFEKNYKSEYDARINRAKELSNKFKEKDSPIMKYLSDNIENTYLNSFKIYAPDYEESIKVLNDKKAFLNSVIEEINKNGYFETISKYEKLIAEGEDISGYTIDDIKKLVGNLKVEFLENGKIKYELPASSHELKGEIVAISDNRSSYNKLNSLITDLLKAAGEGAGNISKDPIVRTFLDISKNATYVLPEYTKPYNLIHPIKSLLNGDTDAVEFLKYVKNYKKSDVYNSIINTIKKSNRLSDAEKAKLISQYTDMHNLLLDCKSKIKCKTVFTNKGTYSQYVDTFFLDITKKEQKQLLELLDTFERNQITNAINNIAPRSNGLLNHCNNVIDLIDNNKELTAKIKNYNSVHIDPSDTEKIMKRSKAIDHWESKIEENKAILKNLGYSDLANEYVVIKRIRDCLTSNYNSYEKLAENIDSVGVAKFCHEYINDIDTNVRKIIKEIIEKPGEYKSSSLIKLKSIASQLELLKSLGLDDYDFYVSTYRYIINNIINSLKDKDYVGIVSVLNKYSANSKYAYILNIVDSRMESIDYLNQIFKFDLRTTNVDASNLEYKSNNEFINKFVNDVFKGNTNKLYDNVKSTLVKYKLNNDKDKFFDNLLNSVDERQARIIKYIVNDKTNALDSIFAQPYITDNFNIVNQYGETIFEFKNNEIYDKSNKGIFVHRSSKNLFSGDTLDKKDVLGVPRFVVDVETTGRSSESTVWQVSVNYTINGKRQRKTYMVDPDSIDPKTIEEGADKLYEQGLVGYAKSLSSEYRKTNKYYTTQEIEDEISNLITSNGGVMVAHNANFDFNMLNKNGAFEDVDCIDTISLYKQMTNYFIAIEGYTNFSIAKVMPSIKYIEVDKDGVSKVINEGIKDSPIIIKTEYIDGELTPKLSTDGGKTFNNLHDAEVDTELTSICFDEALNMITKENSNITFADLDISKHKEVVKNRFESTAVSNLFSANPKKDITDNLDEILDIFTSDIDNISFSEDIKQIVISIKKQIEIENEIATLSKEANEMPTKQSSTVDYQMLDSNGKFDNIARENSIDICEFEDALEQLLYCMKSKTYSINYDAKGIIFETEHVLSGCENNIKYIDYVQGLLDNIRQYRDKCVAEDLITYKLVTNQEYFIPMYNRNYIHDINIIQYESEEIQDLINMCLGDEEYFIVKNDDSRLALAHIFNDENVKDIPEISKLRDAITKVKESMEFEKQIRKYIFNDLKNPNYIDIFSAMRNAICDYTGDSLEEIDIKLNDVINMYLNRLTDDDLPNVIGIKNKILEYAVDNLGSNYGLFMQPNGNFTSFIFNQLQETLLQSLSSYSKDSKNGMALYDSVFSDIKASLSEIRDDLSGYRKANKQLSTHLISRDDVAGNLKLRTPDKELDLNNIGNLVDNNCMFTFKKSSQLRYDGRLKSNIYEMFNGIFKPYDPKNGAAYVFSKDTLVGRKFNQLSNIFGIDYAYFIDSYKYRSNKELNNVNKLLIEGIKDSSIPLPNGVNKEKLLQFINDIENMTDVDYIQDMDGFKNIYLNAVLDSIFKYGDIIEGGNSTKNFTKNSLYNLVFSKLDNKSFNNKAPQRRIKSTVDNYNQVRKLFINRDGTPDIEAFKSYLKNHKEYTLVWCNNESNKLSKVNLENDADLEFALTHENSEKILFSIVDDDTYRGIAHDLSPQKLINDDDYFDVYQLDASGNPIGQPMHHIRNNKENSELIDGLKDSISESSDKFSYKYSASYKSKLGKVLKNWWLVPSKVLQLTASLPFLVQNFTTAAVQNARLSGNPFDFFSFIFGCSSVAVRYHRYNRVMNSFLNNIDSNLIRDYILDINKNLEKGQRLDWVDILTTKGKSVIDELKQFALDKGFITKGVEDAKFTKYFDDLEKCFKNIDYDDLKRMDKYMNYTSTMGYTAELNLSMDLHQRKQNAYEELVSLGDKDAIYLENPDPNNGCKSLAEELKQLNEKLKTQKLTDIEYKRRQKLYVAVNKDENSIAKKIKEDILTKGKRIPGTPAWTMDVNEDIEHIVRIQALENMEAQGLTEELAKHKVIEAHFMYNDKSKAEQLAEFFIPFISYPIRASSQLEQLVSDHDFVELMYLWDKENWKDEDRGTSSYIAKRRAKGDIPVGNKLVSVGNPLTESIYNLEHPGESINNKMNPVFKPIYDLATGAKYNRVNQLPIVSQVTNFYNLVANGESQFTNNYYKFSYNNFYLPHQSYNRVYPRFYNSLYTRGGQSRILMNMQNVNNNNLKYRVNSILKKY